MRRTIGAFGRIFVVVFVMLLVMSCSAVSRQLDRSKLPGRQVRISAIPMGSSGGSYEFRLGMGLKYLHQAGAEGVDLACLPENFASRKPEVIPGRTTNAVAELARKYNMYVICPMHETAGDKEYNTAVLIDRKGKVVGKYRKAFPACTEKVHAGPEDVPVFDTDFGRIAILTCFDLRFPEVWHQCAEKDAELVFWPSAFGGGIRLGAYAMLHHYYVVGVGHGTFTDIDGQPVKNVRKLDKKHYIATLDLDRTMLCFDFNFGKTKKLLEDYKGRVIKEWTSKPSELWLLKATAPGVRVKDLCKKYQILTYREYERDCRKKINDARKKGVQVAIRSGQWND